MAESDARAAVNFLLRTARSKAGLESLELPRAGDEAPVTDFDSLSDTHKSAVAGAAAKLDRPEQMTPNEHFALEAIIIPDRRPAILIADDDYRVTHRDWLHLNDRRYARSSSRRSPRSGGWNCRIATTSPMAAPPFWSGPAC